MKLSHRPLVAVLWNDAHAMAIGEFTEEEIGQTGAYQFTTYGLLVRDDSEIVAVASEEGEDGKLRGVTFIPRGMVVEITDLGLARKRPGRTRRADVRQRSQEQRGEAPV